MSFKEGFAAITQIQSSGQKLGEIVAQVEALKETLADLRQAQDQTKVMIGRAKVVIVNIETAAGVLSQQHASFDQLAKSLPAATEAVLARAEDRIAEQHSALAAKVEDLPAAIERVIEQKLASIMSQLETRISDRLRDELKDTRMALRDAMEVNSRAHEAKLDSAIKEIIAEMPRGLLGRRGRG